MIITSFERAELLDHFATRPDIWNEDPTSRIWYKTDTENNPIVALRFRGPSSGPFPCFEASFIAVSVSDAVAQEYGELLLSKWTSYGYRMRVTQFFMEDDAFKLEPKKALQAAIAVVGLDTFDVKDPDHDPVLVQRSFWPDLYGGYGNDPFPPAPTRFFPLSGHGGFVRLIKRGEENIQVHLSLPSRAGGFGPQGQLAGFIRPRNGNIAAAMGDLFGVPEGDPQPPSLTLCPRCHSVKPEGQSCTCTGSQ